MKKILGLLTLISCLSGCMEARIELLPGPAGQPGEPGKDGTDGKDGTSCSVAQAVNGAVISCQDGSSMLILNGQDGAQTSYAIIEIIDLCKNSKEVLLRLGNNQLIGHYANGGNKQSLRIIGPGNWISADNAKCYFIVNNDMSVFSN